MNVVNVFEPMVEHAIMPMMSEVREPARNVAMLHTLRRSGSRPLSFSGRHLGTAFDHRPGAPLWHELHLYQADDGRYVADIRVAFRAEGAKPQYHVAMVDSLEDALQFLERHDPRADVPVEFDLGDPSLAPAEVMVHAAVLRYRLEEAVQSYRALLGTFLEQVGNS